MSDKETDSGNTLYRYELEIPGDENLFREDIEKKLDTFVHHPDGVWCTKYEDGVATVVSPVKFDFQVPEDGKQKLKKVIADLAEESLEQEENLREVRRENKELRQKVRQLRAGKNYREKVNKWIKENSPELEELTDGQISLLTEIDKKWGRGSVAGTWTISEVADERDFSENTVRKYVYEFQDKDWVKEVGRRDEGCRSYSLTTDAPLTPERWDSSRAMV